MKCAYAPAGRSTRAWGFEPGSDKFGPWLDSGERPPHNFGWSRAYMQYGATIHPTIFGPDSVKSAQSVDERLLFGRIFGAFHSPPLLADFPAV